MAEHPGSCHCGAVRFKVETELDDLIECNCSHCSRKGLILAFVPPERFTLHAGEDVLLEYRFNKRVIQHLFCPACGVETHGRGQTPDGKPMVAVNVRTLEDVDPWSLNPKKFDGRNLL